MDTNKRKSVNEQSPTTSRRAFIGSTGAAAGALFAGSSGALGTLRALAASTQDTDYATSREILYLDGVQMGPLAGRSGGLPFVASPSVRTEGGEKGSGVGVSFEPLTLQFGVGMSSNLYQWVADALQLKQSPHSGFVVFVGFDGNETGRLNFTNALITEVSLPAFDSSSTAVGVIRGPRMSITLLPEFTQLQLAPSTPVPHAPKSIPKAWASNGFSLKIDKVDGKRVMAVDSQVTTIDVATAPSGTARAVTAVRKGNLEITVSELDARPYLDWFNQLWGPGGNPNDPALLRTATLEMWSPDLKTRLGLVTFSQVGVAKISPQTASAADALRKAKVELYVGSTTIDPKTFV